MLEPALTLGIRALSSKQEAHSTHLHLESRESALRAVMREYLAIASQELGLHAAARYLRARPARQPGRPRESGDPGPGSYLPPPRTSPIDPRPQTVALDSLIIDSDTERHLQFSPDALQSRMRMDDPYALIAPYTRQMMSFLLFNPDPARLLMIGLGGGSQAKFCYRHLPGTRITVVEIDARVLALRGAFFVPEDDERFQVVHDDGVKYLAGLEDQLDAILVDAYDEGGVSPSLASPRFFRDVARNLTPEGVLVMNLHGKPDVFASHLAHARAAFHRRALLVSVPSDDNAMLCAFRENATPPSAPQLFLRARYLQSKLKLHFRSYLQRLRQGQVL